MFSLEHVPVVFIFWLRVLRQSKNETMFLQETQRRYYCECRFRKVLFTCVARVGAETLRHTKR